MIGLKIWLRRGQALALDLWRGFMARLFYRLAAGDYGSQVIERGTGAVGLGRRCCVFVHFDARGVVRPHTRAYLLALREAGFGIIFVTNSGVLAPDSRQWLGEHCAQILIRRNRGYDFGAYRDGIAAFEAPFDNGGKLLVFAPEITFRAQTHGTYKLIFNALYQ